MYDIEPDDTSDYYEGYVTEERANELFIGGLQAMREMIARTADLSPESIRATWNPSWGPDPGKPDKIVNECWEL